MKEQMSCVRYDLHADDIYLLKSFIVERHNESCSNFETAHDNTFFQCSELVNQFYCISSISIALVFENYENEHYSVLNLFKSGSYHQIKHFAVHWLTWNNYFDLMHL